MDLASIQNLMQTPLGQVVEKTNQVFWLYSHDLNRVLYVSSNYEKIWGHSSAKLYEKSQAYLEPIHPNDRLRVNISIQQLVNQQDFDEEYRIILPDQSVRWIHDRGYPIFDANGNVECFAGITEDITEQKAAEETLQETELKFQQFANHADIVFWICDPDVTQFYYISPYYEKLWCRTRESIYQDSHSFLLSVHPDDLERVKNAAVGDNAFDINEEYRIIRPDGSIRWIRDRTFPVKDKDGNVYRMVGLAEDITNIKQAQETVCDALQRERELNEAKSSFITTTSHEIRTPLAIIQSSIDLLQNYAERLTNDKKQKHFQKIESSVQRITNIIQDILLVAEGNARNLQYEPSNTNVLELCQEITALIADNNNPDNNIESIEFIVSGDYSSMINLDSKLINYILTNLFGNAIKYSPPDSRIEFELGLWSDHVSFRVTDRGIGIDSKDLPHVFDSFYRARNVGNYQGTGLGLAIVKQCVDLHQGKISVSSVIGEGTTFIVKIFR